MCQNTTMRVNGAWIKRYCVLCSRTYNTCCHNFPVGSRQAARVARICGTSLFLMSPGSDWAIIYTFPFVTTIPCSHNLSDRKTSNISHTKSPNWNVSRLSLAAVFAQSIEVRCSSRWWRCRWSSADRRCSNYIWVINNFAAHWSATYTRGLTVYTSTCNVSTQCL